MMRAARVRRARGGAGFLTAALVVVAGLSARPALGFVRYRTAAPADGGLGAPYAWGVSSISIQGYAHGIPSIPADQIGASMSAAVAAWSKEDVSNAACSFLDLSVSVQPATTIPPDAVHDNTNTIALRDGVWTSICSTTKDGLMECHQPGELALTTVWSRSCGEIVEADVEVNADTSTSSAFMWADLDFTSGGGFHDLQNALTHEMGHFIGLDHTCALAAGAAAGEVDDQGNPVPDCNDATAAEMDATMYPSSNAGDVTKRTLSPDDRNGLCSIYPLGTSPNSCGGGLSSAGGCAVAPAGASTPSGRHGWRWLGGALALGAAIALRARRRPRGRDGRAGLTRLS